jgi:hypothetical protein
MSQAGLRTIATVGPEIPIEFVTNSGTAEAVLNVIEILGAGGVTTSGSGNVITINVTGGAFTWNSVTSVSPPNPIQILAANGYVCMGASQVTFILPLAPNFGDEFIIMSNTSTFKINENGSQVMRIGAQITTAGSGSVTSNTVGDFVQFVYVGANTFLSFAPQGTISIL